MDNYKGPATKLMQEAWNGSTTVESDNYSSLLKSEANEKKVPKMKPEKVIGNGAFGFVFEAYDENRKCKVAVKRTQKAGTTISREFEILDLLKG